VRILLEFIMVRGEDAGALCNVVHYTRRAEVELTYFQESGCDVRKESSTPDVRASVQCTGTQQQRTEAGVSANRIIGNGFVRTAEKFCTRTVNSASSQTVTARRHNNRHFLERVTSR